MHLLNYTHTATADQLLAQHRVHVLHHGRHATELAALRRRRAELAQQIAGLDDALSIAQLRPQLSRLDAEINEAQRQLADHGDTLAEIDRRLVGSIATASTIELERMRTHFGNSLALHRREFADVAWKRAQYGVQNPDMLDTDLKRACRYLGVGPDDLALLVRQRINVAANYQVAVTSLLSEAMTQLDLRIAKLQSLVRMAEEPIARIDARLTPPAPQAA